jgi:hypothetical protein
VFILKGFIEGREEEADSSLTLGMTDGKHSERQNYLRVILHPVNGLGQGKSEKGIGPAAARRGSYLRDLVRLPRGRLRRTLGGRILLVAA